VSCCRGCLILLLLLSSAVEAQTNCGIQHTAIGVFICYPNPSESVEDSLVPDIFHLSAQGNTSDGQMIAGYEVKIDNRRIYENKLSVPTQRLSIETNLKSPFDSGSHSLQLVIHGAGSAEVKAMQFHPSKNISFCEPFTGTDPRICGLSPNRRPLKWSLANSPRPAEVDAAEGYSAYISLYGQNLKSVEADVSDAMAVDDQGNLYVASHALADVDLRKYAPDGSLIYASVIRSCSDGFLSVTGIAIANAGRVWIAGNSTACLPVTAEAIQTRLSVPSGTHGFVMLVDTSKPGSAPPVYVTYLSDKEARIAGIRVDTEGNAYLAGTTESVDFPHDSLFSVGEKSAQAERIGFVAALNPSGPRLLWSTLLQGTLLTALAVDETGSVYLTGRIASRSSPYPSQLTNPGMGSCDAQSKLATGCDDAFVAKLRDRGRELAYLAQLGGSKDNEGRAISTVGNGKWIVITADSESLDFPTSSASDSRSEGLRSFLVGLQPCKTEVLYSRLLNQVNNHTLLGIERAPALDAFAMSFSGVFSETKRAETGRKATVFVKIGPPCPAAKP
jgi:hypothetical protein